VPTVNENPDGTAYYHCKFCQHTWPQSHFRNAQQFGAHCSNCSRKRKVKGTAPIHVSCMAVLSSHLSLYRICYQILRT
jgi:hypothetical protein